MYVRRKTGDVVEIIEPVWLKMTARRGYLMDVMIEAGNGNHFFDGITYKQFQELAEAISESWRQGGRLC